MSKKLKRFTAALLGLCLAGQTSVSVSALERHPLDINGDSCFDLSDIICVTKYIHGYDSKTDNRFYFDAADMDGDRQVDIFDLGLLKHALLYGYSIPFLEPPQEGARFWSLTYREKGAHIVSIDEETAVAQTDFALKLMQASVKDNAGKNVMLSPYSVTQALGMAANGAAGDTLKEMETVLGGSMETLNPVFRTLRTYDSADAKFQTANSIWLKGKFFNSFFVDPKFLQTNADYYGADVCSAPFNASTLNEINHWVKDRTDGMIPAIIDEIPGDAVMYLINAAAFDAEWDEPYSCDQDGSFTAADGTAQDVKMLYRDNFGRCYYKTDHALGFRQDYKGGAYYFAAFLPEEGMTPEELLGSMTAESLHETLQDPPKAKVSTYLPEFSYDFETKLNDPLKTMGMQTAFTEQADFSRIFEKLNAPQVAVSNVFHKTHIEVTKMGTRAGASTALELVPVCSPEIDLTFDRPFVYMIVEAEHDIPLFIGTVNTIQTNQ